ncbi:MAG: hypothetical protein KBF42_03760 [Chitinophagales bacterium]|jgi:hypothetical protein|nr:hypothetical protein [Bacteroidota bacterium]MBK7569612.1 hypothetical protein [Bacteroidota bacterium]MBP8916662.1 hypothetical protein [Chitinophagales bacterium]MBP9220475.1 hypothetical protein [Chitinophagales bacterium]MBP9795114.1 hypothetical protein [Chitinophagales bacterium]
MSDYLQTGIGTIKELFTFLSDRSKSKDIIKNNILRELRDNLKLLEHRDKEGVNIKAIIDGLQLTSVGEAYKQNYNFDKLLDHNKKLEKHFILNKSQEKYIGWNADKFIYSLEGKIKDLKNLPILYTDITKAPVNLSLRFDNLYYQSVLFVLFIRDKK